MSKITMAITLLLLPFYWIRAQYLLKYGSLNAIENEMKRYPKHYFGLRRIKVQAQGVIPDFGKPAIYVSNHQSMNDIFVALAIIERPVRFVAKIELFQNVITKPFMTLSKSYPLDREDAKQSLVTLKEAVNDANEGHTLVVFPEGTRSHAKEMLPFKEGIFQMLRRANTPIIPMYIEESFNEKKRIIHVHFANALEPEVYQKMRGKELADTIRTIMETLYDAIYSKK